jgi:hypothetical protein
MCKYNILREWYKSSKLPKLNVIKKSLFQGVETGFKKLYDKNRALDFIQSI